MSVVTAANNSVLVTSATGVPSLGTSVINDFSFTSSTAGATRTLTVSNTDNTNAATKALVQVTTGGASAGDPLQTFTITGATSFSLGLDNSASDAFVIAASTALGTTNVMSVATTGEINFPLQTAFLAYLPSTDLNKTGAGAVFTLGSATAFTEVFDQNSDFVTTGTLTAPVTGRYQLNAQAWLTGCAANFANITSLVTSNRTYAGAVERAASSTDNVASIVSLCDMDAADTCTVTVAGFGEAGSTDDVLGAATLDTFFSGYLAV